MKVIKHYLNEDEHIEIIKRDNSEKIDIIIYDAAPDSCGTSMFLYKQQVLNLIKDLKYIIGE
jgi:hypothetical protein